MVTRFATNRTRKVIHSTYSSKKSLTNSTVEMENNRNTTLKIKNTARHIQNSCKLAPKSAFNAVIRNNANSGRNKQWKNIKDYFLADCERAKIALISPNPNPQLQGQFDPEWSANVAEEVHSRTTPTTPNTMGGKRRTRKGRKGRKSRKSRR